MKFSAFLFFMPITVSAFANAAITHEASSKITGTWTSPCDSYSNVSYQYQYVFRPDQTADEITLTYKKTKCAGYGKPTITKQPYEIITDSEYKTIVLLKEGDTSWGGVAETKVEFGFIGPDLVRALILGQKKNYDGEEAEVPDYEIKKMPVRNYSRETPPSFNTVTDNTAIE